MNPEFGRRRTVRSVVFKRGTVARGLPLVLRLSEGLGLTALNLAFQPFVRDAAVFGQNILSAR